LSYDSQLKITESPLNPKKNLKRVITPSILPAVHTWSRIVVQFSKHF